MNSLKNKIRNFVRVEDGLVTVEWVALTAGMVVAAVAIGFIVMQNTYNSGEQDRRWHHRGVKRREFGNDGSKLSTSPDQSIWPSRPDRKRDNR